MPARAVLIVEHDPPVRRLLRAFLERRGFLPLEADTGAAALLLARRHRPGMVLLDLALPGEEALVVAQELLQRAPADGLRVAVFTGQGFAGPGPNLLARVWVGPLCAHPALDRLERDLRCLFDRRGALLPWEALLDPAAPATTRVLVVENDTHLRVLLRKFLEHRAFAVVEAASGAEALRLAGQRWPDAVLLDLGLPGEDGLVVAQELLRRAPAPGVPITVFSGNPQAGRCRGILARISLGPAASHAALGRLERDLRQFFASPQHRTPRRYPRYPVSLSARCRRRAGALRPHGPFMGAVVRTLSEGGLLLETGAPLPAASLVDLRLSLGDGELAAAGRVVYSRPRPPAPAGRTAYEHGVQFLEMDPAQRTRMRQLIRQAAA